MLNALGKLLAGKIIMLNSGRIADEILQKLKAKDFDELTMVIALKILHDVIDDIDQQSEKLVAVAVTFRRDKAAGADFDGEKIGLVALDIERFINGACFILSHKLPPVVDDVMPVAEMSGQIIVRDFFIVGFEDVFDNEINSEPLRIALNVVDESESGFPFAVRRDNFDSDFANQEIFLHLQKRTRRITHAPPLSVPKK